MIFRDFVINGIGEIKMMNKKQTVSIVVLLMVCVGLLLALFLKGRELNDNGNIENKKTAENTKGQTGTDKDRISVIESKGNTLETRILVDRKSVV